MFAVNVSGKVGREYIPMVEDISRTVVIQLVVQAMLAAVDGDSSFFSGTFWLILTYIVLATMAYHLLVKRLVAFV